MEISNPINNREYLLAIVLTLCECKKRTRVLCLTAEALLYVHPRSKGRVKAVAIGGKGFMEPTLSHKHAQRRRGSKIHAGIIKRALTSLHRSKHLWSELKLIQ